MLAKCILLLQVVSLRPYFNPINKGPAACRSFFIMLILGLEMGPEMKGIGFPGEGFVSMPNKFALTAVGATPALICMTADGGRFNAILSRQNTLVKHTFNLMEWKGKEKPA